MKNSEKIAGVVLLTFMLIGLLSLVFIPISIDICRTLIVVDAYILSFIMAPIAIYGLIRMVGYVFFNKDSWI
jgi:hypothetical protein